MTEKDFRRLALKLPDTIEGSHMGHADFRVGGRIFATCGFRKGFGVLMLTPDQQAGMLEDAPDVFSPAPGAWGVNGSTQVCLAKIAPDLLEPALRMAWTNRVEKNAEMKAPRARSKTAKTLKRKTSR
jgi:hypothetical protein